MSPLKFLGTFSHSIAHPLHINHLFQFNHKNLHRPTICPNSITKPTIPGLRPLVIQLLVDDECRKVWKKSHTTNAPAACALQSFVPLLTCRVQWQYWYCSQVQQTATTVFIQQQTETHNTCNKATMSMLETETTHGWCTKWQTKMEKKDMTVFGSGLCSTHQAVLMRTKILKTQL